MQSEVPTSCATCDEKFSTMGDLWLHESEAHPVSTEVLTATSAPSKGAGRLPTDSLASSGRSRLGNFDPLAERTTRLQVGHPWPSDLQAAAQDA